MISFTVIIPVYNSSKFIKNAIRSALNQEFVDEVIVIDDNSNDNSFEICKELQKDEMKLIVLQNNSGIKGSSICRNLGIQNAKNEYIAFLDADDYYLQNRFLNDIKLLVDNQIDAVVNRIKIVTNNIEKIEILNNDYSNNEVMGCQTPNKFLNINDFISGDNFHINSISIRKSILFNLGLFDEKLIQAQDVDLFFRLFYNNATIISSPSLEPVAVYNIHENNSIKNLNNAIFYNRMFYKKHFFHALKNKEIRLISHFFRNYIEYDYRFLMKRKFISKRIEKILLTPYFFFTLFMKK